MQTQPQRLAPETVAWIERMVRENPLWGTERIRGELLKLNIKAAKRTIQKYMQAARLQPHPASRCRIRQTGMMVLRPAGAARCPIERSAQCEAHRD
jgi:hypothetical protein